MGVENLYNLLVQRAKTDWGGTLGKSSLKLVRPIYEFAKSMTKTSSKVYELKSYNEFINDLIYGNK